MASIKPIDRFEGALLGFAIGDAFGYPARGLDFDQICERFEKAGCLELAVSRKSGAALFTDATQMTLFTLDGIMWADSEQNEKGVSYSDYVFLSLQYWLYTQTKTVAGKEYAWLFRDDKPHKSKLLKTKGLFQNRFVDRSSIETLLKLRDMKYGRIDSGGGNSGNGGLKRVLAAGLYFSYDTALAFRMGCEFAAITHTAPEGFLSAGVYAAVAAELVSGEDIDNAVKKAMKILQNYPSFEKTYSAADTALNLACDEKITARDAMSRLGGMGKTADEALAIALYCAAIYEDSFKRAVQLAANIDGDSEVCAALTGGLLGVMNGVNSIPGGWIKKIQYESLISEMAEELLERTALADEE